MIYSLLYYFEQLPGFVLVAVSLAFLSVIGFLDLATGPEISFSIFYLIPIGLVSWCLGAKAGQRFSILAAVVWLMADLSSGQTYSSAWIPYWNMLVRFGFFVIVASILATVRSHTEKEAVSARRDYLTGLPNARAFHELAEAHLQRALDDKKPFILAYVEAEGLQWINERYGRLAGDQMLCAVAETIQSSVSEPNLVARFSGTLFALLLPGTDPVSGKTLLEALQSKLRDQTHRKYQRPMKFAVAGCAFVTAPSGMGEFMQQAERLMARLSQNSVNDLAFEILDS